MYLCPRTKAALAELIEQQCSTYGISRQCCCRMLQLPLKRYQRWLRCYRRTGGYSDAQPGPDHAPHALLETEREQIIAFAKDDRYSDLSHRQLAVAATEQGAVHASASSFYRVMKQQELVASRQKQPKTPPPKPEVNPDGPNQVWSWDLTYVRLGFMFVYLFAIIDVYSRKIVGWHLSFNARLSSMKQAWDNALNAENLLEVSGSPAMPVALSDHGIQMAKKSAKQFFKDLGLKQLFARYKTPTDNAWIESWFRILKYDWLRYKDYVSFEQLKNILAEFINFYNTQRYHGRIGYVTPEEKHTGRADDILKARTKRKQQARQIRLAVNRKRASQFKQVA